MKRSLVKPKWEPTEAEKEAIKDTIKEFAEEYCREDEALKDWIDDVDDLEPEEKKWALKNLEVICHTEMLVEINEKRK
jgi:hypothetical protein